MKKHTLKIQLMIREKGVILCVVIGKGRQQDFRLFKESKTHLPPPLNVKADSPYQGIGKLPEKSEVAAPAK